MMSILVHRSRVLALSPTTVSPTIVSYIGHLAVDALVQPHGDMPLEDGLEQVDDEIEG